MKNDFDLVVLVDCWPSDHPDVQDECKYFYQRLVSKLSTMNFKYVALATYEGGNPLEGTDTFETDPYIIQSLKSASEGPHVYTKHCLTIQDVYKNFPHLHTEKNLKILVGGQSWWACLHWRPLGFFGWVNQNQVVHSHPDLVYTEGKRPPTSFDKGFENDPYFKWQRETNCVDHTYWTEELRYDFPSDKPPHRDEYLKYLYM